MINKNVYKTLEYDDFQIISPIKMEEIAKKYNQELSEKYNYKHSFNNEKNISKTNKYEDNNNPLIISLKNIIQKHLYEIFNNISHLQKVCSIKFYYKKEKEIKNIINALNDLITIPHTQSLPNKHQTYCSLLQNALIHCTLAQKACLNLFILSENKQETYGLYIKITKLITQISELFEECKYRA